MKRCALMLALLCGCGPASISVAQSCRQGEAALEVETGVAADCMALAATLSFYRGEYEAQWGHVDMTAWTIRVRDTLGRTGETWPDSYVLDINVDSFDLLPHELRHAAGFHNHDGWCIAFEPWERATLGVDERAYLGCL